MRTLKWIAVIAACALLLVLVPAAAIVPLSSGSAGGTLASGRAITAQSDALWIGCSFTDDTAIIRTAGRLITVAPRVLQIDGRTVGWINPRTKSVAVTVEDGRVFFVADNRPVPVLQQ